MRIKRGFGWAPDRPDQRDYSCECIKSICALTHLCKCGIFLIGGVLYGKEKFRERKIEY